MALGFKYKVAPFCDVHGYRGGVNQSAPVTEGPYESAPVTEGPYEGALIFNNINCCHVIVSSDNCGTDM